MKPIAHFSAAMLASAHTFAGTHDVRYYLNGINVRPALGGGVIITATNGHAIFTCRDPEGWCKEELILAPAKPLVSAARKKTAGLFVAADNGTGMVIDKIQPSDADNSKHEIAHAQLASPTATTALGTLEVIDGTFPDAPRVIGGFTETNKPIVMSEIYVAQMKATFSRLSELNFPALDIRSGERQMLVRCSDPKVQAAVLVMGMSVDPLPPFNTDWMAKPAAKRRLRVVAGGKVDDEEYRTQAEGEA